jgi:hypothetical protein
MKRMLFSSALALSAFTSTYGAELTPEDKCHYTLFNPTPTESMRPWRTDHAGLTPLTIDSGHFEVDIIAVAYSHDENDFGATFVGRTESWSYGITQIKIGLLNRLDAEVIVMPYQTITSTIKFGSATFFRETASGFGDVVSRLKLNVWGNDGGKTALSISGDVKYPTAKHGVGELGNGQFEGGPGLEFAAQLPWDFELRINSAVNLFEDASDARQASFGNLMSLSRRIIGTLEGYCMFNTSISTITDAEWFGSVKVGLNYRVANNLELYLGNSFGVTDNAIDYAPFLGIAARF